MIRAWVIGSSGLLGSALYCALGNQGRNLFVPGARFSWGAPARLADQLSAAVQSFAGQIGPGDRWEIHWAAGIGTMGSSPEELAPETLAFSALLDLVAAEPRLAPELGVLSLASSAGAIYAGSRDEIISEHTVPAPTTAYAHEKLRQEDLIRSFVQSHVGMTALIARISTLYGPGHSAGKKQGLLTHIARRLLRNEPIQIYVPFDTIRDYIIADDAAAAVLGTLRAISRPGAVTKIIASEQPTSIAEIISVFKRISRRPLRIVTSANALSSIYSRLVQFRSEMVLDGRAIPRTSLLVGISQILAAERTAYVGSKNHQSTMPVGCRFRQQDALAEP